MSKTKVATKTFAEEGLEAVQSEAAAAEEYVNTTSISEGDEGDEWTQVGGAEPIKYYYRFTAPKKPTKSPFKILEQGQTVTGVYERSFITGKFKNPTYVIRLENGDLVGLPSAGSLRKGIEKLAEGSKVKITYNGMSPMKGGQFAGSDAHNFTVFGNKLKP